MRAPVLILIFVLALAAGAVIRFPLSAALNLSGAAGQGLSWRAAEGTVWNGRVRGLAIHDYPLGDAGLSLSPLSLLTLSPTADLALAGPEADAQAKLTLRPGGGMRLTQGGAMLRLSQIAAIDPRLRARGGALTASGVDVVWRGGRCVSARGDLRTGVLTYGFGGDWRGPEMTGGMACADGVLVMALDGADEGQQVLARADLGGGAYRVEAELHSDDPDLARIAPLIGFSPYGEGWRYRWSFAP